jgi:TrkA family protein
VLGPLIPIVTLLITLSLSLLVARIAAVALMQTGLTMELARFQARSALTGCGFTTSESEGVVAHPVRRRIIMMLMLVGQASIVGAVASVILTFIESPSAKAGAFATLAALCGLGGLWFLASSKWVEKRLNVLIEKALKRWTKLEAYDYLQLMHLFEDYMISELHVDEDEWLVGKSLIESRLADEGVQVLGIHRADGTYIGTPRGSRFIRKDDRLVVYGRSSQLLELERRPAGALGDEAHVRSCAEQEHVREEYDRLDAATNRTERERYEDSAGG